MHPEGELNAGYSALIRHDYDRAIAHFTDAIKTGELRPPDLAIAYHYRGAEYLKTGRDDEAIADFDRALALNPSLSTVYNDRAIVFRRKGDFNPALADYSEAIRLMPRVHNFYLNRGLAYATNGQYAEAIADYKLALYYSPNCVPAFVALGDAHLQQGHESEALADYRQAMRRKGDLLKEYPGVATKLAALGATPAANVTVAAAKTAEKVNVIGDTP
jgi:tetratricopeptide (TPR) repeat protein